MSSYTVENETSLEGRVGDVSPTELLSALVAEMDESALPPNRPQQETSDPENDSSRIWTRLGEDLEGPEGDIQRIVPTAEVTAMLSLPPNPWPRHAEPIAETGSSAVDAHFGSAWDGFTGEAIESTSGRGEILPAFEGGWYRGPLDEGEPGEKKPARRSLQKSGGKAKTSTQGDVPEGEDRKDASDAAAVPDTENFDKSLLPVPVQLARKVYEAIRPRLDRIAEEGLPSWPQNPAFDVADAINPPAVEEMQAADLEAPQSSTRRTMSSRVRPEKPLVRPPLATASPEVELEAPSVQKTRLGAVKKAGQKPTTIQLAAPTTHEAPPSPSISLEAAPNARRPGRKAKGDSVLPMTAAGQAQPVLPLIPATIRTPRLPGAKGAAKTTRKTKATKAPSNGIVGSGIAGPSNSAPQGEEPLYPPELAQRIWDLAEAGKYHAAHGLFRPQERYRRISGEAEVQEYLRDNPEAGEKLKPLKNDAPRKELFLCRSRTFWVPTEEKNGGSRSFMLEHRTTDCPVGYATDHNLYKHVYKFHLKKEYGGYPKKGSAAKEPKPAKGNARQTQKRAKDSKKDEDEDDYADEVEEEYED